MTRTKAIYFDMDGTIANLYGVEGWLPMLEGHDATPYKRATTLVDMRVLARLLNKAQREGYTIGVVSWLAKGSTPQYDREVERAKREWLATHLHSVQWDEVHIVAYGTPKHNIVGHPNGVLFDDEAPNRNKWVGTAYDVNDIVGTIKTLLCEQSHSGVTTHHTTTQQQQHIVVVVVPHSSSGSK